MKRIAYLALLAGAVAAPCTSQYLAEPLGWTRPFPTDLVGNVVSPTVLDFDGDGGKDLAFVDDGTGELIVAWYPEVLAYYVHTGVTGVTAVATLDVGGVSDVLIAVGSGGARLVSYDRQSESVVQAPIVGWDDVREVEAYKADETFLIAGTTASGDTIRTGTWSTGDTFTSLAAITDPDMVEVELADWNLAAPALPEVIVRTQTELRWYSPTTGALIGSKTKPSSTTDGAVTRIVAGGTDQVAWVRWAPNNKWRLHLYQGGALVQALDLDLNPPVIGSGYLVNFAAGDYDGDGFEDLLMHETASSFLYVFPYDGTLPGFSLGEYYLVDDGVNPASSDTVPALFADVNNDQSDEIGGAPQLADLVVVQESAGQFSFHVDLDSAFPNAVEWPTLLPANLPTGIVPDEDYPLILYLNAPKGPPAYDFDPNPEFEDDRLFRMKMCVPPEFGPAEYEYVQVVVWYQKVVPNASGTGVIASDISLEKQKTYMLPFVGPQDFTFTIRLDNPSSAATGESWVKEDQYFLLVRMVKLVGEQVQASNAYLYGLVCDQNDGQTQMYNYYLKSLTTGPEEFGKGDVEPGNTITTYSNRLIGVIKTRNVAPPGLNVNQFPPMSL